MDFYFTGIRMIQEDCSINNKYAEISTKLTTTLIHSMWSIRHSDPYELDFFTIVTVRSQFIFLLSCF